MTNINTQNNQTIIQKYLPFVGIGYINRAYLKDYYMLDRLTNSWKQTAAAALVAVTAALPLTGNPAIAGENQSGATAEPVAATNAPVSGRLISGDIRNDNEEYVEHAPYSASNGRLAVVMYGSDEMILGAIGSAAQYYATKAPGNVDVVFLWAKDNDGDANTAKVEYFANGRRFAQTKVGNGVDPNAIMAEVYDNLRGADQKILKPMMLAQAGGGKAEPATQ